MKASPSDFYISELLLAPFGVLPEGFLPCDGRTLSIADNKPLFTLLGNQFGGNGTTTFGLPDLRGRVPVGASGFSIGEMAGINSITLLAPNVPAHNHNVVATSGPANDTIPEGNFYAASPAHYQNTPNTYMDPTVVSVVGGSQPHTNMMPSLALNWLIAVEGIYPPRPQSTKPEGEQ
jgi:microcystin-dependent protein